MRRVWAGRLSLIVATLVASACLAAPVEAAPTVIASACNVTISDPGHYVVSTATTCSGPNAIHISSSDVTLDLGGRVLRGDGTNNGVVIDPGATGVIVRNGTLTNFYYGVYSSTNSALSNLTLVENQRNLNARTDTVTDTVSALSVNEGAFFVDAGKLSRDVFVRNKLDGVRTDGALTINATRFFSNLDSGVSDVGGSSATGSSAVGNATTGMYLGGAVLRSQAIGNGQDGISLSGSDGTGNVASGNGQIGIIMRDGSTVSKNRVFGNANAGIYDSGTTAATAHDNVAKGNLASGIDGSLRPDNIHDNVSDGNREYGVRLGAGGQGAGTNKVAENGNNPQCDPADYCVTHPVKSKAKPVTIDCSTSPGLLIDHPGTYRLTKGVQDCAAGPAVSITAPHVTFDLGGRAIDGKDVFGNDGIDVGSGVSDVVVRNGTVSDWTIGVTMFGRGSRAQNLIARSNGIAGIAVGGHSQAVGNVATLNGFGILAGNGAAKVIGNVVAANDDGVEVTVPRVLVSHNTVMGNATDGIHSSSASSLISRNVVMGNADDGIELEAKGTISHNRVVANHGRGIATVDQPHVSGNLVRGNDGGGVVVGNQAVVAGNRVIGNAVNGISAGSNARISLNKAIGNLTTGIDAGTDSKINDNKAIGNGAFGITAGAGSSGDNVATQNGAGSCVPLTLC